MFLHHNYPAQFGPVSEFLLQNYDVKITFLSQYLGKPVAPGINHYFYKPIQTSEKPYFFSRYFEKECASMHGIYESLKHLKVNDPDVFIGHAAMGTMGLLHQAYPEVPKIGFFELFYDPLAPEARPEYPVPEPNRIRIPLRNATQLVELEYCTRGYSPTPFQKSTYPKAYQDKIEVLFDGIDTELYSPGEVSSNSELVRTWPADAKIVTYVARGLEAMRGFDIFMEVAHKVSQKRSDVHFVIAGNPHTHYGSEMISLKGHATFKDYVLTRHPYDRSRFHFLDWISEKALVDLYRLSDCHFYWTVPFTLSWSFFQAMATGCLVMGSNTAPVRDVLTDEVNGLMVEPYEIEMMVERMVEVLESPEKFKYLRESARALMLERYGCDVCLPELAESYTTSKSLI